MEIFNLSISENALKLKIFTTDVCLGDNSFSTVGPCLSFKLLSLTFSNALMNMLERHKSRSCVGITYWPSCQGGVTLLG